MDNKEMSEIFLKVLAIYVKSLEERLQIKIEETNKLNETLHQQNNIIEKKNRELRELNEITHKSQDADVIVGAITGNVPRETWERLVLTLKGGHDIVFEDNFQPFRTELAELIERSLEYKWGR